MSHGSYDSNLGSEILTLARDIRSRIWPNIGGTYSTCEDEVGTNIQCSNNFNVVQKQKSWLNIGGTYGVFTL